MNVNERSKFEAGAGMPRVVPITVDEIGPPDPILSSKRHPAKVFAKARPAMRGGPKLSGLGSGSRFSLVTALARPSKRKAETLKTATLAQALPQRRTSEAENRQKRNRETAETGVKKKRVAKPARQSGGEASQQRAAKWPERTGQPSSRSDEQTFG